MLGRTASGLFWMGRYLERAENTAGLVEAGFRLALTRAQGGEEEWGSVLTTAGVRKAYCERHDSISGALVTEYLLRHKENTGSVSSILHAARENARMTRTALTREVWEAINEFWLSGKEALRRSPGESDLPSLLAQIRQHGAQVRGAIAGTMLRNDIYHFVNLGVMIERADNTARILDTKYYVLLPASASIGSSLDNVQWEMILRSASAERAFHWLHGVEASPLAIANFLVFDTRLPRSLAYCNDMIISGLEGLAAEYGRRTRAHELASAQENLLSSMNINLVFDSGLHEFLTGFMGRNAGISSQIEADYRFTE